MTCKQVLGRSWRFARKVQQAHVGLLDGSSTLAVVAVLAGGNQVSPSIFTPQMARNNMVDRQVDSSLTAILTNIVIPAQNLALGQLDSRVRPADHNDQANHRGAGIGA